ncbi:MAG: ChaN family lipoprotein [Alphaproteobacteria bacterium]|nr:ChaN family lipoprotein [Alphaproteobacteria bacterium]
MGGSHQPGPQPARRLGSLAWRALLAASLTAVVMALAIRAHEAEDPDSRTCAAVGTWLDPATTATLATDQLTAALARRPVVLLGEAHDNAEHHRWQLHTLAALHGRNPNMVLGFESFPRRVQPVLDRWVNGELDAKAFLEAVDWPAVWGFDPALYLPLFHFARQNRVPMIALNVERELVSRVRREGWAAIPAGEREGLSNPAPASTAYRESLVEIYLFEQSHAPAGAAPDDPHAPAEEVDDPHAPAEEGDDPHAAESEAEAPPDEPDVASVMDSEEFARFVEAQLTWDRAMAEALAAARRRQPVALVVGIIGRGHIEHRYGIPHQLADLGIPDAAVLLPVDREAVCDGPAADLADAVFVIEPTGRLVATAPKARLGVLVATTDDGVRVANVMEGSVAEATAIEVDDIVVSAAGAPVAKVGELVEIVQRQAPGTWLPLVIRRDGEEIEVVAKFPTSFETPQ